MVSRLVGDIRRGPAWGPLGIVIESITIVIDSVTILSDPVTIVSDPVTIVTAYYN